ncbi:pseudouridine synthase [Mycena olivaceomarginata]|nr:pseudouridine synthase [Mycena olivaceomarginata]
MSYKNWSKEDLIARLTLLEAEKELLPPRTSTTPPPPNPRRLWKTFDFSSHPRRKIALKFCYSGWAYNGLAIQADTTPLPTVEGVIFDALGKARLIDPDAGLEGCGWERCGRTDRGVSAGGQVISLWRAPRKSEHSYTLILNRLLPPTIRILAWSPVAPDFSARFNCKSRHYKYFFAPDNLDIGRMRDAAARLVGLHDFRNFCKLDPAKQLTTYVRRVMSADISPVAGSDAAGMHVLDLTGSAFLYHQVRHIMAVLFLAGSGLEPPSVVTALLNMADALPLMLYACHFGAGDVAWQADADDADADALAPLGAGLHHQLHARCARSEMYAALNREFLRAAAAHHAPPPARLPLHATGFVPDGRTAVNVPLGGAEFRRTAKYVPLLERNRGEHFEVVNERWRVGKGARRDERRKAAEEEGEE